MRGPLEKISPKKYRGLGDVVEAVARPVARMIDRIAGTDIRHCQKCARRREALNRRFSLRHQPVDTADEA